MKRHHASICLVALALLFTSAVAQPLLDPKTQPKFVNPLPVPAALDARNGGNYSIAVTQFRQDLGLVNPVTKQPLLTSVWGYNGTYPGPTILAKKDKPVDILWKNQLTNGSTPLPHLLPIDPSLHWALKGRNDYQNLGVPLVTHLHGGHTESASDGLPDAWFTPNFSLTGLDFVKQVYHYANDQEAATIWYHDHALGITRLNVYAGLAGFYLVTDENEMALQNANQLPKPPYDLGLAIQDRIFTEDGQLHYPAIPHAMGGDDNSIMPEMFGDVILVNGKAWPVLEVEPRMYRFRLLNGSDSRFYNLNFPGSLKFVQIGSDNGLLRAPFTTNNLLLAPGERKDVVLDFSNPGLWGKTIILQNNAKTPFPKGTPPDPATTGQIMAFRVSKPLNTAIAMTSLPANLRPSIAPLQTVLPPRKLILFEGSDEMGRLKPMLGTVEEGTKSFEDPVTEIIKQNATEVWEIYNLTPDAHPVHLHMVTMQLVNRQKFRANVDMVTGQPSGIRFQGQPTTADASEAGWKDTYISYPGEVLRVIAKFDLAGKYVWHCHILSHEDHEMMRPYVVEKAGNLVTAKVVDNEATEGLSSLNLQTVPNPFAGSFQLRYQLDKPANVVVTIYDEKGAVVKKIYRGNENAGPRDLSIDGQAWRNGIYFCELLVDRIKTVRKMVLEK